MKVPGAAVASAAFAGVVVFITQIYSEPRRSRPEPRHSTGGRDGSYKPRFGSIEFHVLMADKIASELREPNRRLFVLGRKATHRQQINTVLRARQEKGRESTCQKGRACSNEWNAGSVLQTSWTA
jgi:hypothetical protein